MMEGLKPCSAIRDSGMPRLGKVPAHWEVLKLRQVLRRHTERKRPDLPLLSVVREQGVIVRDTRSSDENHNYIPDDLSDYKVVRAGQFVINKMKAWQGSYGVSCHDGIVSPAYFVFDVFGLRGDFFHAAIRSRAYIPAFHAGIRWRADRSVGLGRGTDAGHPVSCATCVRPGRHRPLSGRRPSGESDATSAPRRS